MDRIEKFLQQLSKKERQIMLMVLTDIKNLSLDKYDIKPLRGYKGVYRLRKGRSRVIFAKVNGMGVLIDANFRPTIYLGL